MNLKQFKQQLQQLEEKLVNEYNLTDEEINVTYFDWVALDKGETNLQLQITELNILEQAITIF